MDLVVSQAFTITGHGVGVLFVEDPKPWLPWLPHLVRVTPPGGESFETVAFIEFARKVPPGEVMGMRFPQHTVADIPVGSQISVLGVVNAPSSLHE